MTEYTKEDAIKEIMRNMSWDREKALVWMRTSNPFFGGTSADHLFDMDRGHKVMQFIQNAKEGNFP